MNSSDKDQYGRTWIDEKQAWCVEGQDGEWVRAEMLCDVPPPFAQQVKCKPLEFGMYGRVKGGTYD